MSVSILRLDHRQFRDQRLTTHVALTARALGAKMIFYSGDRDENLESTVNDVVGRWGGDFEIVYTDKVSELVKKWKGITVHLTMYGENHKATTDELKQHLDEDILVVVGGAKVPRFIYENVDFNTSIGWQPHSEVAALGIFLNSLLGDQFLYHQYEGSSISIQPDNQKSKRSDRFKIS